ncbi:hypothetical protein [Streptomyces sp. NPDC048581]|uniref:hypothetical protein n=1 Tax=unclassified Streptomyces TaxID=2593676 RepID=UPI003711CD0A
MLAVGAVGAMCLEIAILVLLITVRPVHIDTVTAEGRSRWATLEPEALCDPMRADLRAERVSFRAAAEYEVPRSGCSGCLVVQMDEPFDGAQAGLQGAVRG